VRNVLLSVQLLLQSRVLVRQHLLPLCRANHRKPHLGLEVRLVETGNHTVGVVGLELSVDVLLEVYVDEVDAAASVVVKAVVVMDSHDIPAHLHCRSVNEDEAVDDFDVNGLCVDCDPGDGFAFEVDGQFLGDVEEVEGGFAVAVVVFLVECDVEVVGDGALLDGITPGFRPFLY